mmetsp:Transcript_15509/g.40070  ORF Transcript_15509/g.40070 Transcript_15509/m.40070 type:complete len:251 (-) Transcript_15509:150-902(-)|eukprot:CAMPEP_0115857038 /NCGR_PEP_ID=MMETSP0287-20121206/15367_1 /TAXON_ID=412157 /ORGANISM="Chrysochromulina rotalis, Strain UIO044" /LENGTH=250 /DNA_ID=CAMNT_0003311241 /DNA_START=67 /DNA_END=819 /DNA_ORIENTATION=+
MNASSLAVGVRCGSDQHSTVSTTTSSLMYIGSDVDVSILRLMRRFETHALFVDGFGKLSDEVYAPWHADHQQDDDSRRFTTQSIRPITSGNATARTALLTLAKARLRDEGFGAAREAGLWSVSFAWHQRQRNLTFRVQTLPDDDAHGRAAFRTLMSNFALEFPPVSTLTCVGMSCQRAWIREVARRWLQRVPSVPFRLISTELELAELRVQDLFSRSGMKLTVAGHPKRMNRLAGTSAIAVVCAEKVALA